MFESEKYNYISTCIGKGYSQKYIMQNGWMQRYFKDAMEFAKLQEVSLFEGLINFLGTEEKTKTFPKYLYKFYRLNNLNILDVLNSQVHFADVRSFNDIFDSTIAYNEESFIKKHLAKTLKNKIDNETYYKIINAKINFNSDKYYLCRTKGMMEYLRDLVVLSDMREVILNELTKARNEFSKYTSKNYLDTIKIACFASNEDEDKIINNLSMWAHYADNGKGFCVRYDIDILKNRNFEVNDNLLTEKIKLFPVISAGLFPVYYRSHRGILSYLKSNNLYKKQIALMNACLTKATVWSKEQEYRIILNSGNSLLFNNKLYFPFVDHIFLGSQMDEELKISLASACNKQKICWTELKPSLFSYKFEEGTELRGKVIKRELFELYHAARCK